MNSATSQSASNLRPDDEQTDSSIPEPPNAPDGGIPDLDDDAGNATPDKASSQEAQEEQDRQLESGEENPG